MIKLILSTVQKILPLLIIVNIIVLPRLLIFVTFFTILVIFFRVPGRVTLNKVLALSSITKLILIFILIYSVLLIGIIFSTDIRSNSSFYQIERLDNFSKIVFIFIGLNKLI